MHFVRLANELLKDEESAWDNHVTCNFAKYSPVLKICGLTFLAHAVHPSTRFSMWMNNKMQSVEQGWTAEW